MSAIGSVVFIVSLSSVRLLRSCELPARFLDSRYLALQCQRAETQAANFELPQERARPAANVAAVVLPNALEHAVAHIVREFRLLL
jgi:hypothetical protein